FLILSQRVIRSGGICTVPVGFGTCDYTAARHLQKAEGVRLSHPLVGVMQEGIPIAVRLFVKPSDFIVSPSVMISKISLIAVVANAEVVKFNQIQALFAAPPAGGNSTNGLLINAIKVPHRQLHLLRFIGNFAETERKRDEIN